MLINYANEKLQFFFIESSLRREQEEYAREGIGFVPLNIEDNAHVCTLLGSPLSQQAGLFAVLDERAQLADRSGGTLQRQNSSSSSFNAKGAAASLSQTEAAALASAQVLLDVLDDKMNHSAFHKKAFSNQAQEDSKEQEGDGAADSSSGYTTLQPLVGYEDDDDGNQLGENAPGGVLKQGGSSISSDSSTYGIVFNEAEMRFVKMDETPPGTFYDEMKMQFVAHPKSARMSVSPQLSPQGSQLGGLGDRPSSPGSGCGSGSNSGRSSRSQSSSPARSAYRGSVHYRSRKDNGDLAGQLFGVRHYAGEVSFIGLGGYHGRRK